MSKKGLSVLNYSDSTESKPESSLDVVDVPDRILEALHHIRQLQLREVDSECKGIAEKIEALLSPVPAVLAAAAVRLAEVA